jgi:23S rRNA (cytosine1962-C5)-methyltransferase
LLSTALAARRPLLDPPYESALRLFNGFLEGYPALVIELYADTLVMYNHADPPEQAQGAVRESWEYLHESLPWVKAVLLKSRHVDHPKDRQGRLVFGEEMARKVRENSVWYALDLALNQDTSFYLDTRHLRQWAIDHLAGKTVLNTFAYTGSLGVAAMAAGAQRVIHLDRNRIFLNLAKASYTLNGFPILRSDFRVGDFFPQVSALRRAGEQFDCVFLDPPFFSQTQKGTVNLLTDCKRLINKVRPLVSGDGWLVVINNALFVSGADYLRLLEDICTEGYLTIEELIPVPSDCTGYPETRVRSLPADPSPFNHATKIAILRGKHKNGLPSTS